MKRNILIASILAGSVGIDQITKIIVRSYIDLYDRIEVLGSFVILTHVENVGAFLGLGSDWPAAARAAVFGVLSGCIVVAALVYLFKERRMRTNGTVAMACIAGGGIGNMIDRIIFGGRVTDFANIGIGRVRTGVFNIADVFLMLGLFLFLLEGIHKRDAND